MARDVFYKIQELFDTVESASLRCGADSIGSGVLPKAFPDDGIPAICR
jgi:hypothetical protein